MYIYIIIYIYNGFLGPRSGFGEAILVTIEHTSLVFSNSNRSGVAASRFLGAASALKLRVSKRNSERQDVVGAAKSAQPHKTR